MVSGAKAENSGDHCVGAVTQVRTSTRGGRLSNGVCEVLGPHQRAAIDRVDHAAGPR